MKPNKVLVVTWSQDFPAAADWFLPVLRARGVEPIVFFTDRFPTEHRVSMAFDGERQRYFVDVGQGPIELDENDAIWYRRSRLGQDLPAMNAQIRNAALAETREFFESFLTAFPGFRFDPYERIRRASRKPWQQELALQVGLRMPRTLITNDPVAARRFVESCPGGVAVKILSAWTYNAEDGSAFAVHTNRMDASKMQFLDDLRFGPMMFQEFVEKDFELRVTVVGNRMFAARLDTSRHPGADVDWRMMGIDLIDAWTAHPLPAHIEASLGEFLNRTGLQYSAADFMVDTAGEYFFLEANTNGEFLWLQTRSPRFPIFESIADVIADVPGARRRFGAM